SRTTSSSAATSPARWAWPPSRPPPSTGRRTARRGAPWRASRSARRTRCSPRPSSAWPSSALLLEQLGEEAAALGRTRAARLLPFRRHADDLEQVLLVDGVVRLQLDGLVEQLLGLPIVLALVHQDQRQLVAERRRLFHLGDGALEHVDG